jgi:2-polyprenyl-6-methoxyphenol hydroxylase-like FAD-dependent oxidoreductase
VDVAIIGSGMTGLAAAKHLLSADENVHVAVFEARELCSGATGRNGGHLKPNAQLEYRKLAQQLGAEQANKVAAYQLINCDHVRALASELCPEESEIRDVKSFGVFTDQKAFDEVLDSLAQYQSKNPSIENAAEVIYSDNAAKVRDTPDIILNDILMSPATEVRSLQRGWSGPNIGGGDVAIPFGHQNLGDPAKEIS